MKTLKGWMWVSGFVGLFLVLAASPTYAGIDSVVHEGYYSTESQGTGNDPISYWCVTVYSTNDGIDGETIGRDTIILVEHVTKVGDSYVSFNPPQFVILDPKNVVTNAGGTIERITVSNNWIKDGYDIFGVANTGDSTLTSVKAPYSTV